MTKHQQSSDDPLRGADLEGELKAARGSIRELQEALRRERQIRQEVIVEAVDKERHRTNQAIQKLVEKERQRANTVIGREMERLRDQVSQGFAVREAKRYQPFSRRLTSEDETLLLEDWSQRLGLELRLQQIRYFEHRLNHLEDLCQGRLAGRIQDAILRVVVGLARSTEDFRMLEIGTLFGVGFIGLWDLWASFFPSLHLTLIDPLESYHSQGAKDPVTGIPISWEVLQRNLRLADVPEESVTLLRGEPTDPEILDRARGCLYDLILLDGDHSFEGVSRDFKAFRDHVEMGGFLVFDDYGHPGWPGVKEAVDQLVVPHKSFEQVGVGWNTAVFRRVV
ncbi:MAG: class I SAM-dependent methyltransferase [Deltaproteobacteria bacterium]|nr:class I SAM-dependent methyltransferase [Deltaproteobacteria bacterium]